MASATSLHQRTLREFLKEQQEPFVINKYVSQRGCSGTWSLQRSANSCLNMNAKLLFSRVLTSLYKKLALHTESGNVIAERPAVRYEDLLVRETPTNIGEIVVQTERFSSSSSSTLFYSCSEIDDEDEISFSSDTFQASNPCPTGMQRVLTMESTAGDAWALPHSAKFLHAELQHLKMASLIGLLLSSTQYIFILIFLLTSHRFVLAEVAVNQDARKTEKKTREHSNSSAAIWGLLMQSVRKERGSRKLRDNVARSVSQGLKSKRVLQKTKQMIFYCAREKLPRKGKGEQRCQNEEVGKFICNCKRTNQWGQRSRYGNGRGLSCLFSLDDLNSAYEWSDLETHLNDIILQIADAILECISNEIVSEFIQ